MHLKGGILILGLTASLLGCRSRPGPYSSPLFPAPPLSAESLLAVPRGSASLELQGLQERLESGKRTFRLDRQEEAALELRIARLQSLLGKRERALSTLDALVRDHAGVSEAAPLAWILRARIEMERGDRIGAVKSLDAAVEKGGRNRFGKLVAGLRKRWGLPEKTVSIPANRIFPMPPLITRAQWKSRRGDASRMDPMGRPTKITIHHSAMLAADDGSDAESQLRAIQRNHIRDMHWADIGYHFLIDRMGRVFEGREFRFQGAHAGNGSTNRHNIGICLLGNFQPGRGGGQFATRPQTEALLNLLLALTSRYRIPPARILTHREIHPKGPGATACPGRNLLPLVSWIRKRFPDLVRSATSPPLDGISGS